VLTLAYQIELLARRDDLRGISEGFRGRSMWDNAPQAVLFLCAMLFIVITMLLVGRLTTQYEKRQSTDSLSGLFRELCRIHQLNHASRRLLKRLASQRELEGPVLLFVRPELFRTEDLSPDWQEYAAEIERLRNRLFT
jgi:hypothetical protein